MPTSKAKHPQTIAFIGLGNMGAPMAVNLVNKGHQVRVYDLSAAALATLAEAGATSCSSVSEAAKGSQVVITMLPAGQHVKSILLGAADAQGLGDAGLLNELPAGTLVIDSSTIAAADARLVAQAASSKGIEFVDAPVSGGTAGAIAGTLTFIVGGTADAFARAKPVLKDMGKNIFHAGDAGAGQVAKICNNMLLGILMTGTAEALNLGVKNGLDAKVLSEIMLQSSGRNWTLEVYNPYPQVMDSVPASRGYSGGFMTKLMQKDLNLALQTAKDAGVPVPMASQATALYDEHVQQFAELDFSSIMGWHQPSLLK